MEAAGLASSILTFLDISYKIVKGAHEIYTSATGATVENTHVSNVITDLEKASGNLSVNTRGRGDLELEALSNLCRSLSQDLLKLLHKLQAKDKSVLRSFSAAFTNARKQKDVASIEKRLDHYREQILLRLNLLICQSQSSIQDQLSQIRLESERLESKRVLELESLHRRLADGIEVLRNQKDLQNVGVSSGQTAGFSKTEDIEAPEPEPSTAAAPTTFGDDERNSTSCSPSTVSELKDLVSLLDGLRNLATSVSKENNVLRALHFDALSTREDTVQDTASDTFAWIVRDVEPNGSDQNPNTHPSQPVWLGSGGSDDGNDVGESDDDDRDDDDSHSNDVDGITEAHAAEQPEYLYAFKSVGRMIEEEATKQRETSTAFMSFLRGSGNMFSIFGKAGSGKSTLMKFLGRNKKVQSALADWADGRKLVHVNMFFWKSGNALQKSLEGFYRTILFQTLRQCPELIGLVFPSLGGGDTMLSFAPSGFKLAFDRFMQLDMLSDHRFVYFIDGLDEYEGDTLEQKQLAEDIAMWSRADHVKIICSSRPYPIYMDILLPCGASVRLQDLTTSDILAFVNTQFEQHLKQPAFDQTRATCLRVADDIVTKAEGVFLWASLVVRSLLNAALAESDESSLIQTLDDCPSDLNSLFGQMLKNKHTSPSAKYRSDFILDMSVQSNFPYLPGIALSWLHELHWFQKPSEFPFDQKQRFYDEIETKARLEAFRKQLHFLTGGLLELHIHEVPYCYHYSRVDFFHRTVRDFLADEWLPQLKKRPFESRQFRLEAFRRLWVATAKFAPPSDPENRLYAFEQSLQYLLSDGEEEEFQTCAPFLQELECALETGADSAYGTLSDFKPASNLWISYVSAYSPIDLQSDFSGQMVRVSFLHLAAYYGHGEYVRKRLCATSKTMDTPDLSLLLSASLASLGSSTSLINHLHSMGLRMTDSVIALTGGNRGVTRKASVTLWDAFLLLMGNEVSFFQSSGHVSKLTNWCSNLETLLQVEAAPTAKLVISKPGADGNISRHHMNLSQIVSIIKPPNEARLMDLLSRKPNHSSRKRWLKRLPWQPELSSNQRSSVLDSYPPISTERLLEIRWDVTGIYSAERDEIIPKFGVREY